MNLKSFVILTLTLLCVSPTFAGGTSSNAAKTSGDSSYEGLYFGGNIGYVHSQTDVFDGDYNGGGEISHEGQGPKDIALFIGKNWILDDILFGTEMSVGFMNHDSSAQSPGFVGDATRKNDSIARLRAGNYIDLSLRVGYIFKNDYMTYFKLGLVETTMVNSYTDTNTNGTTLVSGTKSGKLSGGSMGLGIEKPISNSTQLRFSVNHYNMSAVRHTAISAGSAEHDMSHNNDITTYNIGFVHKF